MESLRMNVQLKAFGITREIVGAREKIVEVEGQTVAALRAALLKDYPKLSNLRSLMVAVNNEYADDSTLIHPNDEVALIPPVSGG